MRCASPIVCAEQNSLSRRASLRKAEPAWPMLGPFRRRAAASIMWTPCCGQGMGIPFWSNATLVFSESSHLLLRPSRFFTLGRTLRSILVPAGSCSVTGGFGLSGACASDLKGPTERNRLGRITLRADARKSPDAPRPARQAMLDRCRGYGFFRDNEVEVVAGAQSFAAYNGPPSQGESHSISQKAERGIPNTTPEMPRRTSGAYLGCLPATNSSTVAPEPFWM
jgi:hypothetical protein